MAESRLNGRGIIWAAGILISAILVATAGLAVRFISEAHDTAILAPGILKRIETLEAEKDRIANLAAKRGEYIDQADRRYKELMEWRAKIEEKLEKIEREQLRRSPFIPKKLSEVK
jgi:hypothetical protein